MTQLLGLRKIYEKSNEATTIPENLFLKVLMTISKENNPKTFGNILRSIHFEDVGKTTNVATELVKMGADKNLKELMKKSVK